MRLQDSLDKKRVMREWAILAVVTGVGLAMVAQIPIFDGSAKGWMAKKSLVVDLNEEDASEDGTKDEDGDKGKDDKKDDNGGDDKDDNGDKDDGKDDDSDKDKKDEDENEDEDDKKDEDGEKKDGDEDGEKKDDGEEDDKKDDDKKDEDDKKDDDGDDKKDDDKKDDDKKDEDKKDEDGKGGDLNKPNDGGEAGEQTDEEGGKLDDKKDDKKDEDDKDDEEEDKKPVVILPVRPMDEDLEKENDDKGPGNPFAMIMDLMFGTEEEKGQVSGAIAALALNMVGGGSTEGDGGETGAGAVTDEDVADDEGEAESAMVEDAADLAVKEGGVVVSAGTIEAKATEKEDNIRRALVAMAGAALFSVLLGIYIAKPDFSLSSLLRKKA